MTTASPSAERPLTPLEQALENVSADKSLIQDFYDLFLESDLVVGTRGQAGGGEGREDDLIVLIDDAEIAHLPVFASDAAMDSWEGADRVGRVSIPAVDLLEGVDPKMRIVLNPGLGVTKVFDPKEIRMLRRMARRSERKREASKVAVSFAPVTKIPDEIYTRLAALVSSRRTLKAIYILDVEDKQLPSGRYMLVLIDIRPSDFTRVGEKMAPLLSELFEEGLPVEIGCLQEERMWADLVQDHGVAPVYPRKP